MIKIGDKVEVQEYSRTRTIFNNADTAPGKTVVYNGGWTGTVTNIFDDGNGGEIFEVHRDYHGDNDGWYEFSYEELKKI